MQNFSDGKIPVPDNKASSLYGLAMARLHNLYEEEELIQITYWLLEHYAGITRPQYLQNPGELVNQSTIIHFCNAIEALQKGTPIQYVIGVVDFYGLKLQVNPSVLIPRPETEELVDIIRKENEQKEHLKVLDVGTGSGCIALSLARCLKGSKVTAIDISPEALNTARKNAADNHIANVEFLELDFLEENYFIEREFDIIVSNPPYIAASESNTMARNVLDFEPSVALFVPDKDPLVFYHRLAEVAALCLRRKGLVYAEINERLGPETQSVFMPDSFSSVHLLQDLFGKNRFIKATSI